MTSTAHRLLAAGPAIFAVLTLPLAALASILGGGDAAGIVAIVGWLLLTPLSAILAGEVLDITDDGDENPQRAAEAWNERRERSTAEPTESADPLDRLRERYAEGDIDEAEFERRLDLLLDTENADPETAHRRVRERTSSK